MITFINHRMKRYLLISVTLLAATAARAQKAVPFKLKFLPNRIYTVSANTDMISKVESAGQAARSKTPSKRSMENKGNFVMSYQIKTGSLAASGSFPYTLIITDFKSTNLVNGVADKSAGKNPVIGGRSAGTITADGKMHMESLTFPAADQKTSKAVISMVNKFGDEIRFPARPMKVGESFTQEKPFNFANGGTDVGIKTVIVYTLRSVKGDLAYFDTKETITMNVKGQKSNSKTNVNTTGHGKGTMVYDIANNFAIAKTDNLDTRLNLSMGASAMKVDAMVTTNYKAKISAR